MSKRRNARLSGDSRIVAVPKTACAGGFGCRGSSTPRCLEVAVAAETFRGGVPCALQNAKTLGAPGGPKGERPFKRGRSMKSARTAESRINPCRNVLSAHTIHYCGSIAHACLCSVTLWKRVVKPYGPLL